MGEQGLLVRRREAVSGESVEFQFWTIRVPLINKSLLKNFAKKQEKFFIKFPLENEDFF